jgi:hypothetical protein
MDMEKRNLQYSLSNNQKNSKYFKVYKEIIMARKKKGFSTSGFSAKAASSATIDVSNVTGKTQLGSSEAYPVSASITVTEASAVITDIVISGVSLPGGNTFSETLVTPYVLTGSEVVPFDVIHSINQDGVTTSEAIGQVLLTITDPAVTAGDVFSSSLFTLSGENVNKYGAGALPGETENETRTRLFVEGII